MAELNELTVRGDSLLQGNLQVNGTINGGNQMVDSDCMIIDVCKKLDLTTTGVKAEIEIPSGYVGMPVYNGTEGNVACNTYLYATNTSATSASMKATYTDASNNTQKTATSTAGVMSDNTIPLTPFIKGKLTIEVTSASDGLKCALIARIYCLKQ